MATSSTEICNLALSWLAGNRIASLADDSDEARLCNANYAMSRRAVLEEAEWTFAVKRAQLPSLAETPLFGYAYQFLLPPDLLYSVGVYDPGQSSEKQTPVQTRHAVENDKVLADLPVVFIKYIADVINTNRFSPLFDQTVAAHIAMNIAVPLTENESHFDRMAKLYTYNLDKAASSNGMQGTREMLAISQQEQSRRMFVRPA
jgi:hypothetical protein